MANKIKVDILYYPNGFDITKIFEPGSWQEKSFKDEMAAIEWIRKHSQNIMEINDYPTLGQPVSHFEIMDAIRSR